MFFFFTLMCRKNCSKFNMSSKISPIVTTRVVFLYRVRSYKKWNRAIRSRLYRVEYFCYSKQIIPSKTFLLFRVIYINEMKYLFFNRSLQVQVIQINILFVFSYFPLMRLLLAAKEYTEQNVAAISSGYTEQNVSTMS